MAEIPDQTTHKGRPKKVVAPNIEKPFIKEQIIETDKIIKRTFTPVIYVSKSKETFITVKDENGNDKYFEFHTNGACGVCSVKNEKEVEQIESSNVFGKHFYRVEDESKIPSGSAKPNVVIGARHAMAGNIPSSNPVDAQMSKLIAESQKDMQEHGRIQ
jgi:hypothetical protein